MIASWLPGPTTWDLLTSPALAESSARAPDSGQSQRTPSGRLPARAAAASRVPPGTGAPDCALLALAFSAVVGFTWWSLGLTIAVALAVGYALHLGDTVLEVPISAMLILSVGMAKEAATGRSAETLIGAAAGLIAGLVYARPRAQPVAEAIAELCRTMAGLLTEMAAGLSDGSAAAKAAGWLARARALGAEVGKVEDALRQAEESIRLDPRGPWRGGFETELRSQLEAVEHAAITVRGLAGRSRTAPAWPRTTACT